MTIPIVRRAIPVHVQTLLDGGVPSVLARVYAAWIYRWLEAPDRLRPGAVMPRLFSDDEPGKAERYAAARYLASLGGPVADYNANAGGLPERFALIGSALSSVTTPLRPMPQR